VGLAAGCGEARSTEPELHAPAMKRIAGKKETWLDVCRRSVLVVTVVDGDTYRRLRGARVRIGSRAAYTGRRGVAEIPVRCRRRTLTVRVHARGHAAKAERKWFVRRRKVTVRVYRPELQWPMYGVTPARTQAQDAIRIRPPFRVVWTRGIGSLIEFPAVVSDGVAYVGNARGTVRALSMQTGKVAWRRDVRQGRMAASPAVVGKTLVFHSMDGHVWVRDRSNGHLLWVYTVGSPVESSPLILGRVDYFGAHNGNVYALDLRTRRPRWVFRGGYKITSSVAMAGGTLFVGDYGGRLLALSARTGRLRWARSVNGRIYGTPAVFAGRVFVPSSTGGSLSAFTTGGRVLWRVHTGSYVYSSPAVWRGRVFFGSYNGRLYAVSAASGRVLWSVGVGGRISGAATVVDGVVYAGTGGRIVAADARSGRVLLRFRHGEYVPVSGNGRLLLLHGFSRLYAVAPRGRR
jgi:outer membrane protein assembly factor BamB